MKKLLEIYKKHEEIINYLFIGGCTTLVSLITYYVCVCTFLDPNDKIELQIANVISWIFAVTFAYFTNIVFVFKSKNEKKLKEAISFYSSRILTLLLDSGLMFIFVSMLHFNDKIVKIFVQIVIIIANYILSKLFVFKKNEKNEKK